MADPMSRFESVVDEQIRRARERGEFDDLPGMGKPLPGRGSQDDANWWLKQYIDREGLPSEALLPPSLQLAKEVEKLPERVRQLRSEQAVRELATDLNRRIVAQLRAPSGPRVPLRRVDVDALVRHWREAWALDEPAAPAESGVPAERSDAPGRRRWFRRRSAR